MANTSYIFITPQMRARPSLSKLIEGWLERMPFFEAELPRGRFFDFWTSYREAVDRMIATDERLIKTVLPEDRQSSEMRSLGLIRSQFKQLFDRDLYAELQTRKVRVWSHKVRGSCGKRFVCHLRNIGKPFLSTGRFRR